jgi:hypothetical protein
MLLRYPDTTPVQGERRTLSATSAPHRWLHRISLATMAVQATRHGRAGLTLLEADQPDITVQSVAFVRQIDELWRLANQSAADNDATV